MIIARYKGWTDMRLVANLLVALVFCSACSARKKTTISVPKISNKQVQENNKSIQAANSKAIANYVPFTAQAYIDRFKTIAIQQMNLYGIPASITLAQGLFESGNGNGDLAKIANNHFGIKCTADWKGKSYYKDDDMVDDCFRVYNTPEESYRDHSEFLKRKRYAPLFELDKNDYEGWAYGLKQAGYATNPQYPQLLINVIKKYRLDQYDRPEGELQKIKREDRVLAQITQKIAVAIKDSLVQNTPVSKLYTIKQGDTLYNVSKRFGLTIDELKALNNMADNSIKLGQQLVIAK